MGDCHQKFSFQMRFIETRKCSTSVGWFKMSRSDPALVSSFVKIFRVIKSFQVIAQHVGKFQSQSISDTWNHVFIGFQIDLFARWKFQHSFHFESFVDGSTGNVNPRGMKDYEIGLFGDGEEEFFDAFDP